MNGRSPFIIGLKLLALAAFVGIVTLLVRTIAGVGSEPGADDFARPTDSGSSTTTQADVRF